MKEVIVNAEDLVCLNKEKLQELIRCKDCNYWDDRGRCEQNEYSNRNADDFCSWAERRLK